MGTGKRCGPGRIHPRTPTLCPRIFRQQSLADDAVLRNLTRSSKTRTAGARFVVDPQPLVMSRSKRDEEREFYLRFCVRERWSKRQLERQLAGNLRGDLT